MERGMSERIPILVIASSFSATLSIHLLNPLHGNPAFDLQVLPQSALIKIVEEAPQELDRETLAGIILDKLQPKLLFSSRYNGVLGEEFATVCRKRGIPFVFHLDDNLMEVSPDQGADKVAYYSHPKRLRILQTQMQLATLVYFSTEALRDRMIELGIQMNSYVGPICAAVDLLPLPPPAPADAPLVFGYAASAGHNADLQLALPGIVAALDRFPQAQFELIGSIETVPDALQHFGDRVKHERRFIPYTEYVADLQRRSWSLGLSPLCNNPFTRMKTYTKWVEYTAAGIPVIASDHPIYRDCCAGGAARLVADGDWAAALPELLADAPARQAILATARDRVGRDYSVARLRQQLFEVFRAAGVALPA
jgi:glycosyltransferase involved in cell wall biosynthesis